MPKLRQKEVYKLILIFQLKLTYCIIMIFLILNREGNIMCNVIFTAIIAIAKTNQ